MTSTYPKGLQPQHEWTSYLDYEGYLQNAAIGSDGSTYISSTDIVEDATGNGYSTPRYRSVPYLTKYNSDGSKAWEITENIQGIDGWGTLYATTSEDGSIFIAQNNTNSIQVAKYIPETDYDWLGQAIPITYDWDVSINGTKVAGNGYTTTSPGNPWIQGITSGSDGSIYITGYVFGGNLEKQASIGTDINDRDAFISKISPIGEKEWTRILGSEEYDSPNSIATDSNGSVYISGVTRGDFDGEYNPSKGIDYNGSGFVSKYKSNGTKEWSKVLGTSGYDSVTSIAIDSNDSPYFIGYTNSQSFITRYSSDGSREWTELAGEGEVAAQAVTEDVDGSMLIAGITGGGYYTPKDAVISKINDDGGFDWSKTVGSLGIGGAVKDISVGNKGEIYIIGQDYDSVNHRANHFLSKYEYKIPDYKVTTTHWNDNSQTSIDEGEWITTTVSTENVNQGTELYWEVEGVQGDITLSDFSQGELKGFSPIYGTFADGGFSIPHLIAEDLTTEGLESMVIKLFSDQARNELLAQSSTVEINDSSKTPPPSIPDLIATSDSGISNSDNITSDNTPTFSGTAKAGSSVELFADGISLGSSITDSNSNWAYTVANDSPLADGSIAITATTTTETATSASDPSDPLNLTIDATAPAFSSGETAAPIEENSGAAQVIYTAAADDASDVSYSLKQNNSDDAASFSIDPSTGKVSLKDDPDYENKTSYSFSVSATDLAGNSSEQDLNLGILNQPKASTPDLIATSDSGISNSDNLTNDNTPTFSGTAKAGSSVELFADGISLGSSTTDSNSNWSYTVANDSPLADGSIAITATSTETTSDLKRTAIPVAAPGRTTHEWRNKYAFAALKDDGSVVTWGDSEKGGDSSSVDLELSSGINQIFSNPHAFAALKDDGSVVTWGDSEKGGDSSSVDLELSSGVNQIFSTEHAFAALKDDGSVVTWGASDYGGDSSSVDLELSSGVNQIFSANMVFAALKDDGSVVTWGILNQGGDSSSVDLELSSGVNQIFSTSGAIAALKDDGSVVTWGDSGYGGDSNSVDLELGSGVNQIFSTKSAFAALKDDGSVVSWGASDFGGDSSSVDLELSSGVNKIFSAKHAFAALKDDGSVVSWGFSDYGGDSSSVDLEISSGVNQIFSTGYAFAALKDDGSVVSWGASRMGGDNSSVDLELSSGVSQIFSTGYAFAALKDDGSVVTWGGGRSGGDSSSDISSVDLELSSGVNQIFSTETAFAALKDDGSVVSWGSGVLSSGDPNKGGDSSSVAADLSSGVVSFADPFHDDRLIFGTITSDPSDPLNLTIDATAPTFSSGHTTNPIEENSGAAQVIYTAAADDASAVSYSLKQNNSDDAASFSIDSSTGKVSLTDDPDYENKPSYSFSVSATDLAGNSSEQDLNLGILNQPKASTPDLIVTSDSGNSDSDNLTNDNTPSFSGTAEAGSSVELFADGISLGSSITDSNSNWSYTVANEAPLADGSIAITATTTTEHSTSTSDPSDPLSLTIDATAPAFSSGETAAPIEENSGAAQVIYTAAADDASAVSYSLKQNNNDDAASFSFDASTGKVSLKDDPDYETNPSYSFSVSATDLAGNSSEQDVNLGILNQPKASTPDLIATSDSGISDSDNLTNDNTPSFSGTAKAGSSVEIFADGISLGSSITDSNSNWAYTVANDNPLADGSIAITATTTETSGRGLIQRTAIPVASPGRTTHEWGNNSAFAALKDDGSVVSWGDSRYGGDSSSVDLELSSGVNQIFSTKKAFAALKDNGSVVTWGDSSWGGDSSSVDLELSSGVNQIFSNNYAFAAVKDDGSVVTWGESDWGGDSSSVAADLSSGINQIFSSYGAFAAVKDDGSVVSWGDSERGGDSSSVDLELSSGVNQIFSNDFAFAALKDDGSVVSWGHSSNGGDSSSVDLELSSGVNQIFSTTFAFAAVKDDGSVVSWGDSRYGGDSSSIDLELSSGVNQIFSTEYAFAALKDDGSVVAWGNSIWGGDSSSVAADLSSGVNQIFSTDTAFAAVKDDGSVVSWGHSENGGDSSSVDLELSSGVNQIFSTGSAFAAVKDDGSVVSWGSDYGGDSSSVAADLSSGINQIFSSYGAFAAVKDDGSVVSWGDSERGGDSSSVADQLSSGVVSFADPFHDDRLTVPTSTSDPSDPLNLTIDTTAPAFSSGETAAPIEENSGAAQVIYTAAADDASAVSYSLKQGNSDDAASFSIDPSTGKVSLKDDPDYETKTSYSFSVSATDLAGNSNEQDVNLEIKDIHASYILSTSSDSLNEGEQLTSTVSTHEVISGSEVYWSLSGTGINQGDFTEGDLSGSGQTDADGKFSFSHTLRNDQTREGPESLDVKLFTDALRTEQVGNTASVEIKDTSMSTHYVRRGESAYVIVDGPSWQEAEAYAQRIGGNLVTINDEAENQWLHQAFQIEPKPDSIANPLTEPTWLYTGFNDVDSEGDWEWSSGEDVTYTNWWGSDWPAPEKGWLSNTAENYMHLGFIPPDKWNDTANNGTIQNRGGIAEISLARSNHDIANQWTPNPQATADSDLELSYSLHSTNGTDTQTDLKQLAVLGDSVDWQDSYRLDITAKSLAEGYDLETADITINFDPYLFNEIKASDIKHRRCSCPSPMRYASIMMWAPSVLQHQVLEI
ncbi:Ig-like domain-containing protein [Prochlorococcus sp. MIT 1327]|uniref:Ig-like domain-containing protein n=1 Tax=Prochlorococcus sp. MIT 1327 TaxID=3082527 RepID=UPI0039B4EE86